MTIAVILPSEEKEDYLIDLNNHLNELTCSNLMLKSANKDLSEKSRLSTIEKEQIQSDLKAATVSNISILITL